MCTTNLPISLDICVNLLYINSALEIAHLLNVNRFRVVRAINDPGREMLIASGWGEL